MEKIVLEVDDQVATITGQKQENDIIQFLNELRQEIATKGLTQEILDDIL